MIEVRREILVLRVRQVLQVFLVLLGLRMNGVLQVLRAPLV